MLLSNTFGNPHSKSPASVRTTKLIDKTRLLILNLLNADPTYFDVVFVANTTAAVKLIGEGFTSHFQENWNYYYSADNHTSLIGLRGLTSFYNPFKIPNDLKTLEFDKFKPALVSWTAQSNFTGQKFPIHEWNVIFKSLGNEVYTLLDAAAISSSSPPNLSNELNSPDFTVMSFYKMFGFPDLGALIIRKSIGNIFSKRNYFGGGTVESLTINENYCPRKQRLHESLEDGTLPFHSIIALNIAILTFKSLYQSFNALSDHLSKLTTYLYQQLLSLEYPNGRKVCVIYTDGSKVSSKDHQGPIISFNLQNENGECISYSDFERIARLKGINIRTGTLCNTGGASKSIGYTDKDIIRYHKLGHVCGDGMAVINGKPTGAIRISLGAINLKSDIDTVCKLIEEYYIYPLSVKSQNNNQFQRFKLNIYNSIQKYLVQDLDEIIEKQNVPIIVKAISIFPIKSCHAFDIPSGISWKMENGGLEWDRLFFLLDLTNDRIVGLKKFPKMSKIFPEINLIEKKLIVKYIEDIDELLPTDQKMIEIPLDLLDEGKPDMNHLSINGKGICGSSKININVSTNFKIIEYFSSIIGIPCSISKISNISSDYSISANDGAKSAPLLLVSEESVKYVNNMKIKPSVSVSFDSFRPNLVVGMKNEKQLRNRNRSNSNQKFELLPFDEEKWSKFHIRGKLYTVSYTFYCNLIITTNCNSLSKTRYTVNA